MKENKFGDKQKWKENVSKNIITELRQSIQKVNLLVFPDERKN